MVSFTASRFWWFTLCLLPSISDAMITILDTNKRFASKQDNYYGPLFWKGYQYMARLQYLPGNMEACPSQDSYEPEQQLIAPTDGLPIALLVKSGGCSLTEKARYIKNHTSHSRLVKYIILDAKLHAQEEIVELGDELTDVLPEQESFWRISDLSYHEQAPIVMDLETEEALAKKKKTKNEDRDEVSVPMHVLHISSRSLFQIIQMVVHESDETLSAGGPRVAMDSRRGTSTLDSSGALWIAFSALMGAFCCSCMLILTGNSWWEPPEPPRPQQPRRPQRRRLTKEQVKRLFPIYQFNGESLEPLEGDTTPLVNNSQDVESGADGESGEDALQPFVPRPLDLECCSVCLDEYDRGDRLRCLDPCHHTFHAKCIGRWLSERSATCPLCKIELYDPEEPEPEEDEEVEGESNEAQAPTPVTNNETNNSNADQSEEPSGNNGVLRIPARFFFGPNSQNGSSPDEESGTAQETEQLVPGQGDAPTPLELADNASTVAQERRRSRWWRSFQRLFSTAPRRDDTIEGSTVSLTEPLLTTEEPDTTPTEGEDLVVPLETTIPQQTQPTAIDTTATPETSQGAEGHEGDGVCDQDSSNPDPPGQHAQMVSV